MRFGLYYRKVYEAEASRLHMLHDGLNSSSVDGSRNFRASDHELLSELRWQNRAARQQSAEAASPSLRALLSINERYQVSTMIYDMVVFVVWLAYCFCYGTRKSTEAWKASRWAATGDRGGPYHATSKGSAEILQHEPSPSKSTDYVELLQDALECPQLSLDE